MQNKEGKKTKIDWIIHFVANGVACDCCDKVENSFPKFMCNAHTHGLEKYNHLDFQIVLHIEPEIIGTLLNDLGTRVQSGEKFVTGDVWSDILVGYDVKFVEVHETDRKVLRVLLPDKNNRFPGDKGCEYPYNQQMWDVTPAETKKAKAKNKFVVRKKSRKIPEEILGRLSCNDYYQSVVKRELFKLMADVRSCTNEALKPETQAKYDARLKQHAEYLKVEPQDLEDALFIV